MKTKPQSQSANPYKDDTNWTISNIITLARILLVPLFVAVMVCPWPEWMNLPEIDMNMKRYIAAAIFILISGTDWLDGYLARSRNEVTTFGKFMDPLADKILVAAALLVLIELGSLPSAHHPCPRIHRLRCSYDRRIRGRRHRRELYR